MPVDEEMQLRQHRLSRVRAQLIEEDKPSNLQWRRMSKRKSSIRRRGPWMDILTAVKWLDPKTCKDLIASFEPADAQWRDGVDLWWPNLKEWPGVEDALDDIGDAIESITHLPVKMSNPHVVKWEPGISMEVHIDVGGNNEYPERRWASVIYLNSIKEGGETIFPDRDLMIQPSEGNDGKLARRTNSSWYKSS